MQPLLDVVVELLLLGQIVHQRALRRTQIAVEPVLKARISETWNWSR